MERSVSDGYTDPGGDDGWMECGSRIFGKRGVIMEMGQMAKQLNFLHHTGAARHASSNGDLRGALIKK
jgi:hypothetical protein